jgi:hypothetical protein
VAAMQHIAHRVGAVSSKGIKVSFPGVLLSCVREPGLESFVYKVGQTWYIFRSWSHGRVPTKIGSLALAVITCVNIMGDVSFGSRPSAVSILVKVDTTETSGCKNATFIDQGIVERLEPALGRDYDTGHGFRSEHRCRIEITDFIFSRRPRSGEVGYKDILTAAALAVISVKDDLKTCKWSWEDFMDLLYEWDIATVHGDDHLHELLPTHTWVVS